MTINGNGFTLDGASSFQILSVISGATLNLQFLTLKDSSVTGSGGAILNDGTLTVTNSTLSANQATGALGLGFAGAIRNDGTLTVTNSTFLGNQANAGVGAAGGAIYNTGGTVSLKGSILADSTPDNCNTTLTASYSLADDDTCFTNGSSGNMVVTPTSAVSSIRLDSRTTAGRPRPSRSNRIAQRAVSTPTAPTRKRHPNRCLPISGCFPGPIARANVTAGPTNPTGWRRLWSTLKGCR